MAADVTIERTALAGGAILSTVRGAHAGPVLALLGGVHGDEDEGVLAVHRIISELAEVGFAGTVRAVAPANPHAWAARSRTSTLDNGDLARCFPGDPGAGPTELLAAAITADVITGADVLIDLHSAGVRYAMPLFCGFIRSGRTGRRSEQYVRAFGAPLIWAHPATAPGRTLSVAFAQNIPGLYVEGGGGGGIRGDELATYIRGVLAVMTEAGMLRASSAPRASEHAEWVYGGGGDLDTGASCRHPGFFVTTTEAGAVVVDGDEIGRVFGYHGELLDVITAPAQGRVMFLRRQARVQAGDILFVLAGQKDE